MGCSSLALIKVTSFTSETPNGVCFGARSRTCINYGKNEGRKNQGEEERSFVDFVDLPELSSPPTFLASSIVGVFPAITSNQMGHPQDRGRVK